MPEIDLIIHQPQRLRIMAALAALGETEQLSFTALRELVQATDGNLGAHLVKLEEVGYVRVQKTFVNRKPQTYLSITEAGRLALMTHIAALKTIIAGM